MTTTYKEKNYKPRFNTSFTKIIIIKAFHLLQLIFLSIFFNLLLTKQALKEWTLLLTIRYSTGRRWSHNVVKKQTI